MHTPNRADKTLPISDFRSTNYNAKSNTLEKRVDHTQLDEAPTPKRNNIFSALRDRPLRKSQFMYIRNNRARLIDWYL
jgi:hypothetical protein